MPESQAAFAPRQHAGECNRQGAPDRWHAGRPNHQERAPRAARAHENPLDPVCGGFAGGGACRSSGMHDAVSIQLLGGGRMESTVCIRSGDPAVNRCNRALGVANLQDELRDEIIRACYRQPNI